MRPQEEGLQERVIQMVDDLQYCGINAYMDVTRGDGSTSFVHSLPQWISECDFVMLVGSTTFSVRAKDPTTLTSLESIAIGKKKLVNSNSIIPVLFEGRFGSSFPPGYQDTIGGRFTNVSEYLKEMPGVVASILGVSTDPEIATLLASYAVASMISKASKMTKEQVEEATDNLCTQRSTGHLDYLCFTASLGWVKWDTLMVWWTLGHKRWLDIATNSFWDPK